MNNFRSGSRSRDRKYSPRRSFGGRDSGRSEMFDAVCDECGKDCKVPFRPSGDKPIYCSECFEKKGGRDSNRSDRRSPRRDSFRDRGSSRSSQNNISDRTMSQLVEKIDVLNTKLDAIIGLMSPAGKKKAKLVKSKAKKDKKSKNKKTEGITEALPLVKKKDPDSKTDKT